MVKGILGRKIGMTQVFRPDGTVIAVTAIEAGPCIVTQIKTLENDGYEAVQLGFGETKKLSKPEKGHLGKVGDLRYLREFEASDLSALDVGQKVDVGIFEAGSRVDVCGTSKGKGFAGVVKRHHFGGGPKTHGQSDRHRAPGSIGATTTPGRVLKGMRMAGHLGHERTTVQNLEVVQADPERNLLLVKGAIPGGKNGIVEIKKSVKARED